jgi:opacity protein-like surface antigen
MNKFTLKTPRFAPLIASACLLVGAPLLHAGDASSGGLYMNTDAGVNLMDDLVVPGVGKISLDPGLRWDISMGYAFKIADKLTLGPELETGILYNSMDQATPLGGPSHPASGDYYQVPVLGNVVLNWHFNPHWVAYAGAGAGCDLSITDTAAASQIASETDFAWQVEAGIRYKFGGSSALGLGYKHLAFTPSGLNTVGNNSIIASYTINF